MRVWGLVVTVATWTTIVHAELHDRRVIHRRATLSSSKASTTIKPTTTSSVAVSPKASSTSTSSFVCSPKGTAAPSDAYWLQNIKHQGTAPFNANASSYKVFRNVKDFGAKGDGVTDDTNSINAAIQQGNRCYMNCQGTTITPALVYFPSGTYKVSAPLIALYYTQLVGDAVNLPTLLAAPGFGNNAVIDCDPYVNGNQIYKNQNDFFRLVRNFVIDLRQVPASVGVKGFHWPAAQATNIENVRVEMSTASGTQHTGIFIENGSGGFMGDLVLNGGLYGLNVGNQQYTVRNVTVNNAVTAINALWNWGWTFQGVYITGCQTGFNLATGAVGTHNAVGGESIIDVIATNVGTLIHTNGVSPNKLNGSIVLNNAQLVNVPNAVTAGPNNIVVLAGGTKTITAWGQGNVYSGSNPQGKFVQGNMPIVKQDASLLDSNGRVFSRSRPQYKSTAASQIISVKSNGAKGDGVTDDTKALQAILNKYAGCAVIFFDAGIYVVTDTLHIPVGAQLTGEAWSVISGKGANFNDASNPRVVVQVGAQGSVGTAEISDMIFNTIGPAKGAIVVEWNVKQSFQGSAGMWDSHLRLGGAAGTNLESTNCLYGNLKAECSSAFLALHLTKTSSGYFESTWIWNADHELDLDGLTQVSLFSGRGVLSESQGPVWMIGTASEHHALYQYNLWNAQNHYMGCIQTETPYYQPVPAAPAPFTSLSSYGDPVFSASKTSAWGLYIRGSSGIYVFGADIYNFYSNYTQQCISQHNCQNQIVSIGNGSQVNIANLATIGATYQLSINDNPIIPQSANQDGFQQTATFWSSGN